jgi:toxin YoeB
MGKFGLKVEEKAKSDLEKIYKSGDKSSIKKLEKIIFELSEHPKIGVGNPEQLKHEFSGFWSRRINKKDRLIYEIIVEPENLVVVISALGQY